VNRDAWVLCLGADGHVEVEAATLGQCSDRAASDAAASSRTTAPVLATSDCGPCVDVALASAPQALRAQNDLAKESAFMPAVSLLPIVEDIDPLFAQSTLIAESSSLHPFRASLRTIVLRV
jgi:hypothetical protein